MAQNTITLPISLVITQPQFQQLHRHLFPGDGDEHGAVIAAGIVSTAQGTRLLTRDIFLAEDKVDYVPGKHGYRALTAQFVAEKSHYCAEERLCYLAIHCHGGDKQVAFSSVDIESHERGYPALLDITHGGPVGGLVFAINAAAGDIWTPLGRHKLDHVTVIGPRMRWLYPSPTQAPTFIDPQYDRHNLLFGKVGQNILSNLKVGIVGLGGGGSLVNEWLSRLGVGHIVAIDFDRVDVTNLPRIVGASRLDAFAYFTHRDWSWLKYLRQRLARHKVYVARRVAKQANPKIIFDAVVGNILDEEVASLLKDVDCLFLATDQIQSRLIFNALVHQYLIPGFQIGVKASSDQSHEHVDSVHIAMRPVLPYPSGGCLDCHELIPAHRLTMEAMTKEQRRAQGYIESEQVEAPSVITLNAISAARAVNDFMMMFTGLFAENVALSQQLEFALERRTFGVETVARPTCLDCSSAPVSRRARGDTTRLPCRQGRPK